MNTCQVSLERAKKLPGYVQFHAFCTVWLQKEGSFEAHYQNALANFRRELDENADQIVRCGTEADARHAIEHGKCGALLSIEGAEAISCDPGKLDLAYEQGIRMIAPVWNAENALAGSCVTGGGLTAQGREFVRRAQKLGIILDVSHLSEEGFWDLCDITEKPFVAPEDVTPLMRRHAKAVNFGIVYGISEFSLAEDIGVTRKEAKAYIENYLQNYAGVREYMKNIVTQAKQDGFVTTMFGRRRNLPELKSSNFNVRSFGERVALNTPIQGTAADIIKLAMLHVDRALRERKLQARLVLQVHDELIVECPVEERVQVTQLLTEQMQQVAKLSVPLLAEAKSGASWYEAK